MIVRHYFKNFVAVIQDCSILIYCTIDGMTYISNYRLPKGVDHITIDGEYIRILFKDGEFMYQVKFEDGDCIVGDIFTSDGDEHIDSFMCHDFNEDIILEDI